MGYLMWGVLDVPMTHLRDKAPLNQRTSMGPAASSLCS